jgi:glycosyltransferase involved in cell wall biosynthesis
MKLLVLTPFPPRADGRDGGSRSLASLHRRLAARHEVTLLTLRAEGEPPTDPALAKVAAAVHEVPRPLLRRSPGALWSERRRLASLVYRPPAWSFGTDVAEMHAAVRETAARLRPDVVHAELAVMAQYVGDAVGAPTVVTDHAVQDGDGDDASRRFRARVLPRADEIVVFTCEDERALRAVAPSVKTRVIPLGVEVPERALDPRGEDDMLLFVGSAAHPPNRDALRRIVEDVLPAVRRERPAARLVVVGGHEPDAFAGADAVDHAGVVEDVEPFLARAAVVLTPVWSGGGMRVKTLEALAAGKAVVSTTRGVEGLDLPPNAALVADEPAALSDAVVALLADPARRAQLGVAGRVHVAARFAWDGIAQEYDRLYSELARP